MHVLSCCCFDRIFNRAIKERDTALQIKRKKLLILASFVVLIPSLLVSYRTYGQERFILFFVTSVYVFLTIISLVWVVGLRLQVTDMFMQCILILYSIGIAVADVDSSVVQGEPAWPLFVIVIDFLLICEAPHSTTLIIVFACFVLLCVQASEKIFRYGLFDFEFGYYSQATIRENYDCEKLPCRRSFSRGFSNLCSQLSVFLMDFVCTRGFAMTVLEEKNRILASIEAANHIAISLSRFDLESSEELLDDSSIPTDLKVAFQQILNNLRTYKPYLPQSCFPFDDDTDDDGVPQSPMPSQLTEQTSASDSTKSGSYLLPAVIVSLQKNFEPTTASLLVVNVRNSSSVLHNSIKSFSFLISDLITSCSEVIDRNKGTLDFFLGDRVFANFGACRLQRGHAVSCVSAASAMIVKETILLRPHQEHITDNVLSLNIGVGSGKLTCGDLGSETVMRFSIIGKVAGLVCAVERAACLFDVSILSEEGLYNQVRHTHMIRVHLQAIVFNNNTHIVFEIIASSPNEPNEWMYELGDVGKWDAFNLCAVALLTKKDIPSLQPSSDPHFEKLSLLIENGPYDPLVLRM